MAKCRTCHAELPGIGCVMCSPDVDPAIFDAIERSPEWARAQTHQVPSRAARIFMWVAAVPAGLLAIAWPSYSDAVDRGDASGRPLYVIGAIVVVAAAVAAMWLRRLPLNRRAAVVLARAYSSSRDSRGSVSTNHSLHVATRTGSMSLAASDARISALAPGAPIIAFERWRHLDDVWPATMVRDA